MTDVRRCAKCRRRLTDPASTVYGPVCARRLGLAPTRLSRPAAAPAQPLHQPGLFDVTSPPAKRGPMAVTIYGASDDLIEVEGDVTEEFNAIEFGGEQPAYLAFSDGTLLRIEYSDTGVWRITPIVRGAAGLTIVQAPGDEDDDNYSDRATLDGEIRWVAQAIAFAKKGK